MHLLSVPCLTLSSSSTRFGSSIPSICKRTDTANDWVGDAGPALIPSIIDVR